MGSGRPDIDRVGEVEIEVETKVVRGCRSCRPLRINKEEDIITLFTGNKKRNKKGKDVFAMFVAGRTNVNSRSAENSVKTSLKSLHYKEWSHEQRYNEWSHEQDDYWPGD